MDPSERKSLGEVIRALREASGLTRAELATASNISVEMLAKVEQGAKAPSAKTLRALAQSLGVDPLDLSGRAAAWEAVAGAPGSTSAALRRIALGGVTPRVPLAAMAAGGAIAGGLPLVAGAVGAAGMAAAAIERRDRRQIEDLLRELLEQRITRAETKEDLQDIVEDLSSSE